MLNNVFHIYQEFRNAFFHKILKTVLSVKMIMNYFK
jgi:hypothetical protein